IVGLIYQFLLRSTWNPSGMQKLVDELLHSVIPLLVLIYWYWYENKNNLKYGSILK
ncbi:MAG: Pr6Pr family membrane protein, partial [Chryseobacterium gambrini]|nr:Pr6Pr family membrane protein [Chryseobacterium gambrini]